MEDVERKEVEYEEQENIETVFPEKDTKEVSEESSLNEDDKAHKTVADVLKAAGEAAIKQYAEVNEVIRI